ncbi:hypothetical protein GCM10010349_40750 [Streptomyces flavofungini]|nr:hypothetical protein GCM10010349_40750 [Streptomyces flavofungini]
MGVLHIHSYEARGATGSMGLRDLWGHEANGSVRPWVRDVHESVVREVHEEGMTKGGRRLGPVRAGAGSRPGGSGLAGGVR